MRRAVPRFVRGLRARARDEGGFTLLELMAALTILSIAFFALAAAASTGLRSIAQARQRQAASELSNARLEHLRNIPYEDVGLDEDDADLVRSTDTNNPDYYLNENADAYDYAASGTYEPLVLMASGSVPHKEDPVDVGTTELTVYQYVTWVDDPGVTGTQDYKRLVIVAAYRTPVNTGRPRSVRVAALFTPGGVIIEGDAAEATQGQAVPTPSPTASVPPACAGDTTAPTASFAIRSSTGAEEGFTASPTVTLSLSASDSCTPITVEFSNDGITYGGAVTYDALNPSASWTVSPTEGDKQVWARFKDGIGNANVDGPETTTLDTTLPTVPGTLTRTVSCSGNNRTVSLAWGSSTDTNLEGYRIYRSIDGGAYTIVSTTATLSGSDTHLKTLDSVRFRIAAYDKAGNESDDTNEVSLAKNQCS